MRIIAHDAPLLRWILDQPNERNQATKQPARGMRGSMPVLNLVSCVGRKLYEPAAARDLYCSPWFCFARAVVEHEPWAILSAQHGLVWPDTIIAPYNVTLADQSKTVRRLWADRVRVSLPAADRYVIWAGRAYAEFLALDLNAELPLRGLGIGQQLAFLKGRRRITTDKASLNRPDTNSETQS